MEELTGIVAAAAGVADNEAAELAKTEEGRATLQAKISAKLADVKKNEANRVLKDTRKTVEDVLKAVGVSADVFEEGRGFKENVQAAAEALKGQAADAGKLTDEQVLKLPAVVKLKNELTLDTDRRVKAAETAAAEALKKDREEFQKEQLLVGVGAWADQQIEALKPNFTGTPEIMANQRQMLRQQIIAAGTYQKAGDAYVLVDANGEILKDAMQNPLKPEAKARQLAESLFGLPVSDPKQNSGVPPSAAITGGFVFKEFKGTPPKNEQEATALRSDQTLSLEARKEVKAYMEAQAQGK